ncbi:MAG: FkbM family methyltransferase [Beijerinckiaceae bacterium]|nr:FkbM family methyltransferase [Beijerinckiaceae bacterium]
MATNGTPNVNPDRILSETPEASLARDLRRLEAGLEYLLISQMNAQSPPVTGPASHERLVDYFLDLLSRVAPTYFLDIGANDASMAVRVKRLLPACNVFAFEANPIVHQIYQTGVAAHGVTYVNLALAARDGVATIYAPVTLSNGFVDGEVVAMPSAEPAVTGKSSLLRRNEAATYNEHLVQTVSLNTVLRGAATGPTPRDVALWIDVEGAAYDVLSGASEALERTSVIFIESENHEFWTDQKQCADVARVLISAGFLPLRRDREYGDKQFNTVFIHHSLASVIYPQAYIGNPELRAHPAALPVLTQPLVASTPVKKSYHSLAACLVAEIPVFVPVFNNPTYAANMLRQLKGLGIRNIFFVDNASTYPGMVDFLEQVAGETTVIRLPENKGPYDLVLSETNYACLPDIFCVTDPDLEFNRNMPRDFLFDLLNLTNKFGLGKAGLALDLSDRHKMHEEKFLFGEHYFHIWEWEGQFWQEPVDKLADGSTVFKAKIDTTFALYNKKYFQREHFWDALRVAGPYTCRHLPWYKDTGLPLAEEDHYRATQKFSYYMG